MDSTTTRIIAITGLAVLALGGTAAVATSRTLHRAEATRHLPATTTLEIDTGFGDVTVEAGPVSDFVVTERVRWTGDRRPTTDAAAGAGGKTTVTGGCHEWRAFTVPLIGPECTVHYRITVPASTRLIVRSGTGDVRVAGITGTLEVETGTGDVTAAGIGANEVTIATGTGDIDAGLVARPTSLSAQSGTGDVTLALPCLDDCRYALTLDAGVGSTNQYGVTNDPTAPYHVTASAGTGDVTINGWTNG
jgi:hypothetical protein